MLFSKCKDGVINFRSFGIIWISKLKFLRKITKLPKTTLIKVTGENNITEIVSSPAVKLKKYRAVSHAVLGTWVTEHLGSKKKRLLAFACFSMFIKTSAIATKNLPR